MKIAVLGAGMSGIVLARLLEDKGHEVHLFEAHETPGGLCRTKLAEGFVYDLGGGHILHSRNNQIMDYLLDNTGRHNWNKNIRNTKILYKDRFVKYPFENGLGDLPVEDNYECIMGYVNAHFERKYTHKPAPSNFQDWITYRFGKGIAEIFMLPYNKKIWNYDLNQLGTGWIEGRVPSAPIEDVMKSALGIGSEGYQHQSQFYYPKSGGFEFLVTAMAEPLKHLHLSTPVENIENQRTKWVINGKYTFDDVISTLPLQDLLGIIKDTPPFVRNTLDSLWYNGVATVFIGLNKPFDHNYSWIYLPHKEQGPANRITYLSHYSENNAPSGCASILAEVTYKAKVFPEDQKKLINEVVESLHNCNILNKDNVILTDSYFFKYAYPVYGLKYNEFIQIINNFLDEYRLKRFGRFATHSYLNVDHVVEGAFAFVEKWY